MKKTFDKCIHFDEAQGRNKCCNDIISSNKCIGTKCGHAEFARKQHHPPAQEKDNELDSDPLDGAKMIGCLLMGVCILAVFGFVVSKLIHLIRPL